MNAVLPEWYGPDDEAIKLILETGTIALDANVMLDLYRVGHRQRAQIFDALGMVQSRLFVPYQDALEFQRNRLKVASDAERLFTSLADRLSFKDSELDAVVRDPTLKAAVKQLAESAIEKFGADTARLWTEHMIDFETVRSNDPVREALDGLLGEGSVAERPSDAELDQLRKTANERFDARVPPGYMDAAKEPEKAVGDFLIWKELLNHHASSNRPMLLISRDEKEDWYEIVRGKKIGPRPELRAEMLSVSPDHAYHHTTLASFLLLANKHLGAEVDDSTIEIIEGIERQEQESGLPTETLEQARLGFARAIAQNPDILAGALRPVFEAPSFDPSKYQIPAIDPSRFQIPSIDPSRFQFPTIDPSMYQIPAFDPAKFQLPSIDYSKFQIPNFDPSRLQLSPEFLEALRLSLNDLPEVDDDGDDDGNNDEPPPAEPSLQPV